MQSRTSEHAPLSNKKEIIFIIDLQAEKENYFLTCLHQHLKISFIHNVLIPSIEKVTEKEKDQTGKFVFCARKIFFPSNLRAWKNYPRTASTV